VHFVQNSVNAHEVDSMMISTFPQPACCLDISTQHSHMTKGHRHKAMHGSIELGTVHATEKLTVLCTNTDTYVLGQSRDQHEKHIVLAHGNVCIVLP